MKRALILALMIFGAAVANAASITYYADIFGDCTAGGVCSGTTASTVLIPLSSATLEAAGTGNTVKVPDFNSSLGTLDYVVVTLDTEFIGGLELSNPYLTEEVFTGGYANIPLNVSGAFLPSPVSAAAGVTGLTDTVPAAVQISLPPPYGTLTIDGAWSSPSGTHTASSSSGNITTGLGAFEGLPTDSLTYDVCNPTSSCKGSSGATVASGVLNGTYGNAGGILEVTYDYTSSGVPEPASMFLVGGILLGGGFFWRRRTR